ncbi:MAG: hypothetical protein ACREUU_09800, partial [Gammaproteobacteria bacterium]
MKLYANLVAVVPGQYELSAVSWGYSIDSVDDTAFAAGTRVVLIDDVPANVGVLQDIFNTIGRRNAARLGKYYVDDLGRVFRRDGWPGSSTSVMLAWVTNPEQAALQSTLAESIAILEAIVVGRNGFTNSQIKQALGDLAGITLV